MANIAVYAKRAKALRKHHPNMSWQNAMKAVARKVSGTAAVGKRRRRVSGTAAVGTTAAVGRVRRRSKHIGSHKINTGTLKQVATVAAGMAIGFGVVHYGLRPLELKVARRYPTAAKFMAASEVLVGGLLMIKAKNPFLKAAGSGIMAAGVGGLLKQFNIHVETPAVSGVGEFTHVEIPVNGSSMDGRRRFIDQGYHNNQRAVADTSDPYRNYLMA